MAMVIDVIDRALRILRVKDAEEVATAAQSEQAMLALNQMMRRWEADGLRLGWNDVQLPSDEMPVPPEALRAIAFSLAVELRPEYGCALEADVVNHAKTEKAKLRADALSSQFARTVYPDLPMRRPYGSLSAAKAGW